MDKALSAFADVDFTPPVPRPRPQLTARDVFVYALLFTALTFTAVYLINLVHGILDLALPDPADRSNAEARAIYRIRWAIATLIVSTPLYVWMTIFTGRQNAKQVGEKRSLVRRWLTYLALFASALTFFGDITYVLERFLDGEFTLRVPSESAHRRRRVGIDFLLLPARRGGRPRWPLGCFSPRTVLVVLAAIITGIAMTGRPSQARQEKFDQLRYRESGRDRPDPALREEKRPQAGPAERAFGG